MRHFAVCLLSDHFAAIETVGDNEFIIRGLPHGGQQYALTAGGTSS
jgi:hypothetical protein